MTEENNTVDTFRVAKVLGSEYGLSEEQVQKVAIELPENQELVAREFRAENKKEENTRRPGDVGKLTAQAKYGQFKQTSDFFQDPTYLQ